MKFTQKLIKLFAIIYLVASAVITGGLAHADTAENSYLKLFSEINNPIINQEFQVAVLLHSPNPINGAAVVINYDPQILEVVDANSQEEGTQIQEGNIFGVYAGNNVAGGKILLTGLAIDGPYQSVGGQEGIFAYINFKKIKKGDILVSFEYEIDSTKDTVAVATLGHKNILNTVYDLNLVDGQTVSIAGDSYSNKNFPVLAGIYTYGQQKLFGASEEKLFADLVEVLGYEKSMTFAPAYIYGGYTLAEIQRAIAEPNIIVVHPTISAEIWRTIIRK